jgi:uncharacterized protein (DUF736 family)
VLLSACGSAPKPQESVKTEQPAEPVTGLHALYQMYSYSKQWAPDPQVYELTSIRVSGVAEKPGTSGAWQVRFVSPSLNQSRVYTYAVKEVSVSMHQGITGGKAESWSGGSSSMKPFRIEAAKVDSDKAWEVASKKGAEYVAKHPDMPISYQLAQTSSYDNAAWRVIWGESVGTSSYSILVDATTGEYVRTLH